MTDSEVTYDQLKTLGQAGRRKKGDGYFSPQPALLIATNRSGSTFLLHCLDSHPLIGCERSEPLAPEAVWAALGVGRQELMLAMWSRPGYRVAMFKLSYRQLSWVGHDLIQDIQPKLLHLHRANPLRVIVSSIINTEVAAGRLDHPIHTWSPVSPVTLTLFPDDFIARCRRYLGKVTQMCHDLDALGLPVLYLTYEDLVGVEGAEARQLPPPTAQRICQFLEVDYHPLTAYTRRVNRAPLAEIVENWGQVAAAVGETELAKFLEGA